LVDPSDNRLKNAVLKLLAGIYLFLKCCPFANLVSVKCGVAFLTQVSY